MVPTDAAVETEIAALVRLSVPDYEQTRIAAAARLGMRAGALDRLWHDARRRALEELAASATEAPETTQSSADNVEALGAVQRQNAALDAEIVALDALDAEGAALDAEIVALARLSAPAYERGRRAAAERLGMRAAVLDRLVARARGPGAAPVGQGTPLMFDDPEPAAHPVVLGALLDAIAAAGARHVVLPAHAAHALALWIASTWAVEHTDCAAILLVRSPMPRCGKTTLLDLLDCLVRRPLPAASITPAALFRTVEAAAPTLLIDEGDAFLADNEELRGVINSGHGRANAFVIRTVGDDHEPRRFATFGFKAIALIGRAAETITDRSIVIELRRRLPHERVAKLRRPARAALHVLRADLARWALDAAHRIAGVEPQDVPETLNDRAADSWTPLLAISDLAGGDWPAHARAAAVALSGDGAGAQTSTGAELLADVRAVFDRLRTDRVAGADLLRELLADEERPWAGFNRGRPLSQGQMARRLAGFGVASSAVRLPDGRNLKGYRIEQFTDAFARYLPAHAAVPPFQSVTPSQASTGAGCDGFWKRHSENGVTLSEPSQASTGAGCDGVTLSEGGNGDCARIVGDADAETRGAGHPAARSPALPATAKPAQAADGDVERGEL